jgi:hypothetical protein
MMPAQSSSNNSTSMNMVASTDTLILKASFVNNVHSVSGKASIYKNKEGKLTLIIEDFKTDNGPDLRIYLSKDLKATDFYQIGLLPATSGKFTFALDNAINPTEHKYVLIWCRQYSVLFGNAELKP